MELVENGEEFRILIFQNQKQLPSSIISQINPTVRPHFQPAMVCRILKGNKWMDIDEKFRENLIVHLQCPKFPISVHQMSHESLLMLRAFSPSSWNPRKIVFSVVVKIWQLWTFSFPNSMRFVSSCSTKIIRRNCPKSPYFCIQGESYPMYLTFQQWKIITFSYWKKKTWDFLLQFCWILESQNLCCYVSFCVLRDCWTCGFSLPSAAKCHPAELPGKIGESNPWQV